MSDRVIVKVNDKLVEFSVANDRGDYKILTDDEVVEYNLLMKPETTIDDELQNELNQMVAQVTQNMKDAFHKNMERIVLNMLGFQGRFNDQWEVDSNSKFHGVIGSMISDDMKSFIAKEVVAPEKIFTQHTIDKMRSATKKEFMKSYEYKVRDYVRHEMDSQLKKLVSQEVTKIISTQEFEIPKTVLDIMKYRKKS
jgi:hypothetical protein